MVAGRGTVTVHQADSRTVPIIKTGSVKLIVTSPYLNAYDYHKYHRQRLRLDQAGAFSSPATLRLAATMSCTRNNATPDGYFDDMDACFGEWARVLKRGGRCLIIMGDAIVSKQAVASRR